MDFNEYGEPDEYGYSFEDEPDFEAMVEADPDDAADREFGGIDW